MIKITIVILYLIFNIFGFNNNEVKQLNINTRSVDIIEISPPYLQVYHSVNKYAKEYDIPRAYMFRMLKEETNYKSPLNIKYIHAQTSSARAEGPAQLLLSTARWIGENLLISRHDIRTNIKLNIELSAKFIRWIHDNETQDWGKVFNYYNTGYANRVNQYAKNIVKYNITM